MRTTLYVAPHFDDVALSCVGGLLARRAAGERVVVCTVFTRGVARARARENALAVALADAERIDLGFDDAPDRERVPPSFQSLVLDASVRRRLVREVRSALGAEIERAQADEVWLPLGVGGHVDHRVVFAARDAADGRAKARFYEERPYGFVPVLRTLRRRELAGGPGRRVSPLAIAEQLRNGACFALLAPDEEDAVCTALADRLSRPDTGMGLTLRSRAIRHPLATLPRAASIIRAYRSQTRWLFGDTSVVALWKRLASSEGTWTEREGIVGAA